MHAGITAGVTKPRISQIVLIPDKILLRSVVQMFKVLIASDGYARFDGWPGRQGVDVFLGNGTPQIATRVIGKHLITAGTDGTICAWDWMKGERLWRSNQDFTVEEGHDATGDGDRKYKMSCAEHAHEEVSRDGGVPCINHWAGKIGVGNQDGLIRILKIQDGYVQSLSRISTQLTNPPVPRLPRWRRMEVPSSDYSTSTTATDTSPAARTESIASGTPRPTK